MMELDYSEVENYLAASLSGYRQMMPELWEDALQEGLIQAWRDIEDGVDGGVTTKLKILRRAKLCATRYFHNNGQYSFGKPKNSRDGIRQNSTTVNKVATYLDEFVPVHNRLPNGVEVSKALGISGAAARLALKNIREGRIDHMKYHECDDGSRRKDFTYYSTTSIESMTTGGIASNRDPRGEANRTWEDHRDIPQFGENFEDDLVAGLDLLSVLKQLAPNHQKVLYLYLFEQYNTGDIGRHMGYPRNVSQLGAKAVKNALNQAHIILNPYFGECAAGHKRTEENTGITKREDGIYMRFCSTCNKGKAAKTNASAD